MTSEPLGVGIAGFWHVHAEEYAREVMAHPGTRLVAGWDADAAAGREGAAVLGHRLIMSASTNSSRGRTSMP